MFVPKSRKLIPNILNPFPLNFIMNSISSTGYKNLPVIIIGTVSLQIALIQNGNVNQNLYVANEKKPEPLYTFLTRDYPESKQFNCNIQRYVN